MIKNIDNFIILDQKRIIVLGGEKAREILYFNNTDEIGQSSLNRKNVILLISARQIYYKGLIFSRKARSKLGELVRTKFLNLLPVPENELYYSYFVDEDKTDIRVLCFAVNKSLLDEKYEMISRLGAKIKAVYPVPLLYFLKYRREEIFKEKRESHFNNEDEGFIYLNELADMLYFTVFYKGGIYLHSCNIADYADEIVEIEEYFNEHLNISKLISCKNEKS
nr:hypothetical protein [Halanaerobiaceae bacterium]